ncbi:MAG: PHP domain-containing protein [Firmicutes bacterium HGW-Firmicutes-7]|nr:MAG: PHP domain-containing protein [Firmicutes bacterium HGW-Firmicutes-7]
MDIPNYLCDLHCHTNLSDGYDSPKELIDRAAELKMKVIAITDHDVIPPDIVRVGDNEVDIIEYACSLGLKVIKGSEISCDTDVEDVHILAYGCSWNNPKILRLAESIVKSKIEAYQKLVNILWSSGMNLSWEEILFNNGDTILPENIQKKIIYQFIADKGYAKTWREAKILIQTNDQYNVSREKPDPRDMIQLIHELNGVAVLAHPFLITPKNESLEDYIEMLISAGLDGIEACYTYNKTSYKGSKSELELENEINKRYGNRKLFISGGSDYHGDWRKGVLNPREIGEAGISVERFNNSILNI